MFYLYSYLSISSGHLTLYAHQSYLFDSRNYFWVYLLVQNFILQFWRLIAIFVLSQFCYPFDRYSHFIFQFNLIHFPITFHLFGYEHFNYFIFFFVIFSPSSLYSSILGYVFFCQFHHAIFLFIQVLSYTHSNSLLFVQTISLFCCPQLTSRFPHYCSQHWPAFPEYSDLQFSRMISSHRALALSFISFQLILIIQAASIVKRFPYFMIVQLL